jgi:glycerophosphoryl diester phosphodiesterase
MVRPARSVPRVAGLPTAALVVLVVGLVLVAGCGGDGDGARDGTPSSTTAARRPASASGALVIAHRGASGYAPEHTFAAYDLALEQGADYLEQDLQVTADGVLVVLHDATLDRTARGPAGSCTGAVADKTLAQIQTCDVGSWFNDAHPERADPAFVGLRIPTLEQVLRRYGSDARYYIEIKPLGPGSGVEEPLLGLLGEAGLLGGRTRTRPVLVQSFGPDVLASLHARRPDLPLVQLLPDVGPPVDAATLDRARGYAVAIGPLAARVDETLVRAAHDRCLDLHAYTVDDPDEMARLLDAGVDGMFTNEPDVLRVALRDRSAPPAHCPPAAAG